MWTFENIIGLFLLGVVCTVFVSVILAMFWPNPKPNEKIDS